MARLPMVTRTMKTTKVKALFANVAERTVEEREIVLTGEFKDNKAIEKSIKKYYSTPELAYSAIISTEVAETLYGMTEQDFIAHAQILPPRTAKTEKK